MSTEKKIKSLNPPKEPLMPEKLRKLSGLSLSDKQAEEVIESLTRYARILYNFTVQHEQANKCQNESETKFYE